MLLGCQCLLDAGHSALPGVFLVRMENVSWCDSGFPVPKVLPTRHLGFSYNQVEICLVFLPLQVNTCGCEESLRNSSAVACLAKAVGVSSRSSVS